MKIPTRYLCFILSLFLLVTGLTGCRSRLVPVSPTKEITTSIETKEVVRDTFFKTEPDSAFYKAFLECQEGKVVIKKVVESKPGKYLEKPDVKIVDNVLTADCEAKAQALFAQWKEKYIKEYKGEKVQVPYPVERELTWWQITQIWLGRCCFCALIAWVLITIAASYLTAKNPLKPKDNE